jgi:hypothetical protein
MTSVNESLQRLGLAVLEAVEESGEMGAPSGHLYAALMVHGATLSQYQTFMGTLTRAGLLVLGGQCYTITEPGRLVMEKLRRQFAG